MSVSSVARTLDDVDTAIGVGSSRDLPLVQCEATWRPLYNHDHV